MEVIKAAVMGIAAAMLALYMKSVRPEYSSMISISAGIFIFGFALICLQKITGSIQTLGEYLAVSPVYIRILLRITGIAISVTLQHVYAKMPAIRRLRHRLSFWAN